MVKHKYKVLIPFALDQDDENKFEIIDEVAEVKGSYFKKGDEYVDYSSAKVGDITPITKRLLEEGYLSEEGEKVM
ncbi:MAG: hypothetical protein ACOCXP_04120 [Candidatus Dojkabacteria bacterium]